MMRLGSAGEPAGAVFDTLELMNDPSFDERGIMQTIDHPTTGKVKIPSWPVRFDGAPPKVSPPRFSTRRTKDCSALVASASDAANPWSQPSSGVPLDTEMYSTSHAWV